MKGGTVLDADKLSEVHRLQMGMPEWVPSNYKMFNGGAQRGEAEGCNLCDARFGFFGPLKHHCRRCGFRVCGDCSTQNRELRIWLDTEKPHNININEASPELARVCKMCDQKMNTIGLPREGLGQGRGWVNYCKTCKFYFEQENKEGCGVAEHLRGSHHLGTRSAWQGVDTITASRMIKKTKQEHVIRSSAGSTAAAAQATGPEPESDPSPQPRPQAPPGLDMFQEIQWRRREAALAKMSPEERAKFLAEAQPPPAPAPTPPAPPPPAPPPPAPPPPAPPRPLQALQGEAAPSLTRRRVPAPAPAAEEEGSQERPPMDLLQPSDRAE